MEKGIKGLNLCAKEAFEVMLKYSFDGIFFGDAEGNLLFANDSYSRITGIPKEYIIGKNAIVLEKEGYPAPKLVKKVTELKRPITTLLDYKNNYDILVTCVPIFDENNELIGVMGNLRNMTELNQLRKKLSYTEQINERTRRQNEELIIQQLGNVEMVERSKVMLDLAQLAARIARVDSTVMITGESGVGKDVYARLIHKLGNHNPPRPIMKISCAAIPENLLESELFGYETGAFTGAKKEGKPGIFELVENGTIFLDEIGELPLALQAKLLTVLQDRQFVRLGGIVPIQFKARVIAATNRNLLEDVKRGEFRKDLFYRLNVLPVHIPPLRERKEDIYPLINHFINEVNRKNGTNKTLDGFAMERLESYDWPGNIRELSNVIERIAVLTSRDIITADDLPVEIKGNKEKGISEIAFRNKTLKKILGDVEQKVIIEALKSRVTLHEAADDLGINISTLVRKIQKYSLPKRYKLKHIHDLV